MCFILLEKIDEQSSRHNTKEKNVTMKVTVHTLIRNEDIWIGYALRAVLPFAEKILVFDNGPSSDKSVDVIKSLNSPKILFEEKGPADRRDLAKLRQEMIDKTVADAETEWILIVDADEIWPEKEIKKLLKIADAAPKNVIGIVNDIRNCVGDIYHYLPESFGNYHIADKTGNITIRLMRKTKTLKLGGEYPTETFMDENGPIQNQDKNLIISDAWYLHTSYLQRSSVVAQKTSGSFGKKKFWEKGIKLSENELPEVLKDDSIKNEINVLRKRGMSYEAIATITAPLLKLKRQLK
jgi:glycosyltransferase involved in cell wall biosynthesis